MFQPYLPPGKELSISVVDPRATQTFDVERFNLKKIWKLEYSIRLKSQIGAGLALSV
jgi:hypothetical protein